jgi:hypothetical protein
MNTTSSRQREALRHIAERGRITRGEYEKVTGATGEVAGEVRDQVGTKLKYYVIV